MFNKRITQLNLFAFIVSLLVANPSNAHGLNITTAHVIIRNQSHFTLRLQFDPLKLLAQIRVNKNSLTSLANISDEQLAVEYQYIKAHLQKKLVIQFNQQAIISPNFRFPNLALFRRLIRKKIMTAVIATQHHKSKEGHSHNDREYYQLVEIDGFLAKSTTKIFSEDSLEINFPRELGTVMVTYSAPISQTIKPSKNGSYYRQLISAKK